MCLFYMMLRGNWKTYFRFWQKSTQMRIATYVNITLEFICKVHLLVCIFRIQEWRWISRPFFHHNQSTVLFFHHCEVKMLYYLNSCIYFPSNPFCSFGFGSKECFWWIWQRQKRKNKCPGVGFSSTHAWS